MIHVSLFCSGSPHWRASTVRACDTTCTHYFSSWVFSWFEENDTTINFIFSFLITFCASHGWFWFVERVEVICGCYGWVALLVLIVIP